jgi:hypothetical protein
MPITEARVLVKSVTQQSIQAFAPYAICLPQTHIPGIHGGEKIDSLLSGYIIPAPRKTCRA